MKFLILVIAVVLGFCLLFDKRSKLNGLSVLTGNPQRENNDDDEEK